MTRSDRQGWRAEAKRDRTKSSGTILNNACVDPEGASPRDGTSTLESSRPQAEGREVSAVRSTDLFCGATGIDKGNVVFPLSRSRSVQVVEPAQHLVNGTIPPYKL
jgi:hypothetical protein